MNQKIDASDLLIDSLERHNINLALLIADTSVWVNPEVHKRLLRDTGSPAWYPKVRRARKGEKRGQKVDGDVKLDDNSYANLAIKRATGLGKNAVGFEACHIWPNTCYDEQYHTAVANLVLLPRALAGLSDHNPEIQKVLQWRAYELYQWYPNEKPIQPINYPPTTEWRKPQADPVDSKKRVIPPSSRTQPDKSSEELNRILPGRLKNWSMKPNLNVHKIIALVVEAGGVISRDELVKQVSHVTTSRDSYGAVASLLTEAGNAYGRVFDANEKGIISLNPAVEKLVLSLKWSVRESA